MDLDRDGMAGDAAGGFDDFEHAEAFSVAQVVDQRRKVSGRIRGLIHQGFQGQQVGIGEVGDVDVVADAGAVGSGVVVAEDFDEVAAAQGDVEDQGNEVGLGFVGFAAGDCRRGLQVLRPR